MNEPLDHELPDGSIIATRIEILAFIPPGGEDLLTSVRTAGDTELTQVLGLLRLAEDTLLHGPDED